MDHHPDQAMQPTRFQRLFTDDRPLYFLMAVGGGALTIWTASVLAPTLTISAFSIIQFIGLLFVAACLGAMLGFFPGGLFLGGLLHWVERRNGAPFFLGDEVVILSKRYRGRVSRVYKVWAERHQVRVDIGDLERREVKDVFSYTDVCRRFTFKERSYRSCGINDGQTGLEEVDEGHKDDRS